MVFEKLREQTSHLDDSVCHWFLPQQCFNSVERGWQTLSTFTFNKIERRLKQMLKPFARAFIGPKMSSASASNAICVVEGALEMTKPILANINNIVLWTGYVEH